MTCYRHPSRPATIIYIGVPMCEACWDAECRRQDAEEERAYRERVMAAREKLCSHSSEALPSDVMAAEEEQSGAPVRAREPAPASSAHGDPRGEAGGHPGPRGFKPRIPNQSRARGGRTDPADPGHADAAPSDLSQSAAASTAPARPGLASPSEGGPGQFSLWDNE